jgi:tetratricopeptide (TPR) repeat protein
MGGAVTTPQDAKAHGNLAFQRGENFEATVWYTRAIEECYSTLNQYDHLSDDSEEMLGTLYSNRSATYHAQGLPDAALFDAEEAIKLRPR